MALMFIGVVYNEDNELILEHAAMERSQSFSKTLFIKGHIYDRKNFDNWDDFERFIKMVAPEYTVKGSTNSINISILINLFNLEHLRAI